MPISPARQAAFGILLRIERDGAYSDELLHRSQLPSRDHRLVTELVMGVLRWQRDLDATLEKPLKRKVGALDLEVRIALRLGAYQIRHLERIPTRAAVSESVELIKYGPRRGASGLVNAVLRRLPQTEPSLELSHPVWMIERWRERYGPETAAQVLRANQSAPATYLRMNLNYPPGETIEQLASAGVVTEPTESPNARRLVSGRPESTKAWLEGRVRIQDLSSQMIVPLLDASADHRCLDLCAAPGGKTQQLAEIRGERDLIAADVHAHRIRRARALGAAGSHVVLDATKELPLRGEFDRILVDAPCSGTGSLARNPEIKWRLSLERIQHLAQLQKAILNTGMDALAPAGALVYSTCSIEDEENQQVVDQVLAERSGFELDKRLERLPGRDPGDGFFAVRIRRVR